MESQAAHYAVFSPYLNQWLNGPVIEIQTYHPLIETPHYNCTVKHNDLNDSTEESSSA